tara:strand:- start:49 stop:477 length:429 start_codon:yes stop_codon:yes gene_type:complete
VEGVTPAELLKDLIEEYLEEFEEERAQAEEELDELAPLRDKVPKKVTIKKPVKPKRKSFVARKATVTRKRDESDVEEDITIQNTPKFLFLELVRKLDKGDGIDPDSLIASAEEEGIANPRLQMNKMIRRGILYVHLDRVHVT